MAWRKQSPPASARPTGGHDRAAGGSGRMAEFCSGLLPILMKADAVAFRRYLAEWEEVIGDTAELGATSEDQLRRTMTALLRRPQQFNLPAWPNVAPQEASVAPVQDAAQKRAASVAPVQDAKSAAQKGDSEAPRSALRPPEKTPLSFMTSVRGSKEDAKAKEEWATRTAVSSSAGVYQLDMVTGELVAVPERALAEPDGAPYAGDGEPKPAARRRRRRRSTSGLRQLTFWPAAETG